MAKLVAGLFDSMNKAQSALQDLLSEGFSRDQILLKDGSELVGTAHAQGEEGARPDVEIAGFNVYGIRETEAFLVVRTSDDHADHAADILNRHGTIDLDEREAEMRRAGLVSEEGAEARAETGEETTIPIMEEELEVGKRPVSRKGIRIYSHITERPVEEHVRLRQEKVHVERHAVDRPVSEGELGAFKEGTIELTETSEEPVVAKKARVKEEVTIRKEATERTETIRDTVRGTQVDIEPLTGEEAKEYTVYEPEIQQEHQTTYASQGVRYETMRPVYQYGYRLGRDPRYRRNNWSEVETDIQNDWDEDRYGPWDQFKGAVRSGWERAALHKRR